MMNDTLYVNRDAANPQVIFRHEPGGDETTRYYTARDVDAIITSGEDRDLCERMIGLWSRLSMMQKQQLSQELSPVALEVVAALSPETADDIRFADDSIDRPYLVAAKASLAR